MTLLEATVHTSLLAYLREQNPSNWQHHLTMARIIARTLRLQRSAVIQTGNTIARYSISYLTPALLADSPIILVVPKEEQERLLSVEIPQLQEWLQTDKKIISNNRWPESKSFRGLLLTTPEDWLNDRINHLGHFPYDIPTLIDQSDRLAEWTTQQLTITISPSDWQTLPAAAQSIYTQLNKLILSHPKNPYECFLVDETEIAILEKLQSILTDLDSKSPFHQYLERIQDENKIMWVSVNREAKEFTLNISPVEIASILQPIWEKQPVVLMGGFLDSEKTATIYRQQLGLPDVLSLKFSANQKSEYIQLYIPDGLPLPNTPQFQGILFQQIQTLVSLSQNRNEPIIIIIEDVPLKAQLASILAAEFGSRVIVEKNEIAPNGILVCGWQFWHTYQANFPIPQLLIIATLPIPSPENPLVAGRIAYYKNHRQDWFRLYLLPTALREIQRAVMPIRESQGLVALFDNRVSSRSYGTKILDALEPYARINYIDSIFWL
ncbi:helicase [Aphanothece hegewaldii CCALA 016]|uniref:Helicase n=1 Tax=Aphanothece hegewaldii CCALA 016 TaxID=2107694 RepID=A0A2T1LZT5_9CHRO|nr:helicase C-terminal domain-containing protein [Aphanothece hegewaldii]PSF37918.1 helicase [Aphanothece hegewaldii CCALA 016]